MKKKTLALLVGSVVGSAIFLTACGTGGGGSSPKTQNHYAFFLNSATSGASVVQCKTNILGQVNPSSCVNKFLTGVNGNNLLSNSSSITIGGNMVYIGNSMESANGNYYAFITKCNLSAESGIVMNSCQMSQDSSTISADIGSFRQLVYANNMLYSATGNDPYADDPTNGEIFYCLAESLPTLNCNSISTPAKNYSYPIGVAVTNNFLYYSNNDHTAGAPAVVKCPLTSSTTVDSAACTSGGQGIANGWLSNIAINNNVLYLGEYGTANQNMYMFNAAVLESMPSTNHLNGYNANAFGFIESTGYIATGASNYVQCPANQMGSANCNSVNLGTYLDLPAANLAIKSVAFY